MGLPRFWTWTDHRHGRRLVLWGALLAVIALVLDFLPLVDVLGFDVCFVVGLVAAVAGVDIGHGTVAAARRGRADVGSVKVILDAMVAGLAVLVLPLLLSLLNALRVRNCNVGAGFVFFLLLPVSTVIYAAGTGAAAAIVVGDRRLGRMIAFALPVTSVVWALARLYRDPAVFAFDPFAGYFPGPIYDEALRPPLRLLWFRLANLTWLAAAIATVAWLRPDPSRPLRARLRPTASPLLALGLAVASVAWFENRVPLGFVTTHARLAEILSRETHSQHFVLYTDAASESDDDVSLAQQDLEFRYQQLAKTLGAEPQLPITVYRFPSAAAKKEAVGAATTLFAKPWTHEIFVQADRFPAQRIRHEMAHVFGSAFGDPAFGVSLAWRFWGPLPFPVLATGLIEGMAEAADFDNPSGRFTTHEEAAAMVALGKAPPVERAIGAAFSLESGPRAYTIAGSFCRFLLERFGADKLRAIYRSAGDFEKVYGQPLSALATGWRTFLASLPVDENGRAQAEEGFRRPAIFGKVCARELAARVADARTRMGTAPADAVALLSSTCSDDPGEPTHQLDLAEALMSAGQGERAVTTIAALKTTGGLTRALRFRAANLEALIDFHAGRLPDSQAALKEALANATDDGDERSATVKLRSLEDERSRATAGRVFFGDTRGRPLDAGLAVYLLTEFARMFPGEALGAYLVGRQLVFRDPKLAAPYFATACPLDGTPPEVALDATFLKECRRQWVESTYLAGDLLAARAAATWLAGHADHEADRLRAKDFLARIAWKVSR
jgi:hypothetical protein